MPEWLVESGLGETRLVRLERGEIVEARILLDGVVRAGTVIEAGLVSRGEGGRNAVARTSDGSEYLLPKAAAGATEGAAIRIEVMREAIPGSEPWKRPLAKLTDKNAGDAPTDGAEQIPFPSPGDRLGQLGWNDLIDEARSGVVRFPGGELTIEATRAMTMIDVDGLGTAEQLAVGGAAAAARAILRLDLQGSIGIDLPTAAGKEARSRAAEAIDAILAQPFERTAVNGFGFVQIVRPRRRASLIELAADRAAFEARALLRRAAFEPPGAKTLAANPAIIAVLEAKPDWLQQLASQVGGSIGLRADPSLTMSGGHVERA